MNNLSPQVNTVFEKFCKQCRSYVIKEIHGCNRFKYVKYILLSACVFASETFDEKVIQISVRWVFFDKMYII